MTAKKISIVGCGYLGRQLAALLGAEGHRVEGLVRSDASAGRLRSAGITSRVLDLDAARSSPPRLDADLIYYFAPPPGTGRTDSRLQTFLRDLDGRLPRRFVLVSTSGVYGDCGGEWVDETRPPAPHEDRAWRRLDAEQRCQRWCGQHGIDLAILRVAGIYGPGRLPRRRLLSGEPVLNEAESPWSNRIHIHDLLRVALAAGADQAATGLFNVADGCPSTMTDYFNRVADHLGLPRPPQISMAEATQRLSPGMLGYLRESRRLSIARMRDELGVAPQLAGLDLGLAACGQAGDED